MMSEGVQTLDLAAIDESPDNNLTFSQAIDSSPHI
jgi:hypothetical protein